MPVTNWSQMLNEASTVESKGVFKPLKPGVYPFVIKEAPVVGKTGTGKDKITINPAVESGEQAGQRVFHDFIIPTDNATSMRIFFDQMTAIGIPEDFFRSEPTNELIAQQLHGKRFVAEASHREYNQKTYVDLKKFMPAAGPAPANGPGASSPASPMADMGQAQGFGSPAPAQPQQGWAQPPQQAQPQQGWAQPQAQQAPQQAPAPASDPWGQAPAQPQQAAQDNPWGQAPQGSQAPVAGSQPPADPWGQPQAQQAPQGPPQPQFNQQAGPPQPPAL